VPLLAYVRIAKIFENSTDYSLQNTTRQTLFLPTSREAKYKAKAAIDSLFVRAGDLCSAGLVFVGAQFAFTTRTFAVSNLALVAVWFVLAIAIGRRNARLTAAAGGR
jgi:AAA family ATP:ADP antiporter